VELALGTVQWGMAYGIAGRGSVVPEKEVRAILELAWRRGVRTLDTAAAYGDIEAHLGRLTQGMPFHVVSKIPAIPAELSNLEAAVWALTQARRSHRRLGSALRGLMCHRAEDLSGPRGAMVWRELAAWGDAEGVRVGASVYDPQTAVELVRERGIAMTQLPGNAFDQRVARAMPEAVAGLEVHLRSVFLQGLLLMDVESAAARLPAASAAVRHWQQWCTDHAKTPLVAALSLAKGFAAVSTVVVGVDSEAQFADVADAWQASEPMQAGALACAAYNIIDPRLWSISK